MNLLNRIYRRLKQYFLSGLLLVVPLVITIVVIRAIFSFLDNLLLPYLQPSLGTWITIPGVGILITFAAIFLVGILVTNFIGRKLVNIGEYFLLKIPIAKSIYTSVKQILQTFSYSEGEGQKKVVLVKYPREGIWSVGLKNGEIIHPKTNEKLQSILVIASINPTSGFFIMAAATDVVETDISVEDAMKWIVSGGIVTPENLKHLSAT
jgi:uncharacterized membrane protein